MSTVIPVDIELWLCGYLRGKLADVESIQVGNREPGEYDGSYPLVVVSDMGAAPTSRVTFGHHVGVSVLGWDKTDGKPCRDLAARIYGLLTSQPDILEGFADGSRILAVNEDDCLGPYAVNERSSYCRYYMTSGYVLDGQTIQ